MTIEELKKRAKAWVNREVGTLPDMDSYYIVEALAVLDDGWLPFDADDPATWPEDDTT